MYMQIDKILYFQKNETNDNDNTMIIFVNI